jgi:hypothetical protein
VLGPIDGTFTPGSIDFVDNTSDPNDPRDITDEQVLDQIEANAQGSAGGSNSGSNGSQSTGNSNSSGSQSAANSEDSQVKHEAAGQLAANSPDGDNEDNSADDGSSVDPSMRLINTTPVNLQQQIDDPVTSSGDTIVSAN